MKSGTGNNDMGDSETRQKAGAYRHELKFLCGERQLRFLEEKIRHICVSDSHVDSQGAYLVRSVYFDTYDDRCYHENEAGVDQRKKYRMRIYNGSADYIGLECKETLRGMKRKDICMLSLQQCRQMLGGQPVTQILARQELLQRFCIARSTQILRPKVIVEYTRTPYVYAAGNVRITFDRHIRSSSAIDRFLEPEICGRSVMAQDTHILEVKYDEGLPAAIRELLSAGQQLSRISFSKYVLCRKYGMQCRIQSDYE